jgi:hypothetical protein
MKNQKPLTRPVTFFIKGQLTQIHVQANDPRSDSEITRQFRSARKLSKTHVRQMEKELTTTKDFSLPSSGKLYNIPVPAL